MAHRPLCGRFARLRSSEICACMRVQDVPVAFPGYEQEPSAPLVQDESVRELGKGPQILCAAKKKRRINLPESTEPDLERCGVGRGRGPRTARSTSRFTIVKLLMSARRFPCTFVRSQCCFYRQPPPSRRMSSTIRLPMTT